ncbi:hypothetical protein BU24DRAFT_416727 [Aaosphaeria arxii CBS 175.79]|uniref:CST complex subunit STN1 n=1 Tax=Aaosphaeria arxii CBS 175.79 TaxID=1450172 RepID=A0A6A5Y758_9PLEO|nr:uncharacterized protein BU24DRAFT_416727 [Aaosphaeria arxii CBS 175.79]KAF2021053.1 hypothetical protein BU24DRAFT_416727 [Aaosphaeria arxii CBS 175.79]
MSSARSVTKCRSYPAYCFRISPTYSTWVKLTAADVQALRSEPEFQSQRIYFHLNHPIRFVRLVGVVVAIEDINARYTILTIDDGSGANIEVKIVRLTPAEYNSVKSPSNTEVDNVDVISHFGVFEVLVDRHRIDIGSVIKVKGTISEFRQQKQVELKRIWVVSNTNEEVRAWAETAAFKREVLSKPWHLSRTDHQKVKQQIKAERRQRREQERLRIAYELKKLEHKKLREQYLAKREEKQEARRRKEEATMNAGALI